MAEIYQLPENGKQGLSATLKSGKRQLTKSWIAFLQSCKSWMHLPILKLLKTHY